jgi:hypothetical protein
MTEPVTVVAAGGYLLSKAAATFAALLGALSVSFFYQPKKLHEHGKLAAGAMIGGISVSAAFTLAGIIANQFGVDFTQIDNALGIGYIIGITSVGVIAWVANFLSRREEKDILEVVREIKDGTK